MSQTALWDAMVKRLEIEKDVLVLVTGDTGCQPAGSKVLISNGDWKNIEDIKIGDEIISPQKDGSNSFSKVTNTTNWICKETYDIIQNNRNHKKLYSCSNNHIIPFYHKYHKRATDKNGKRYCVDSFWDFKEYESQNVAKMYRKGFSHQNIGFSSFAISEYKNRTNLNIEPYSLGVWLGNGYFCKQLSITSDDECVINEVKKHYDLMSISGKVGTTCKSYYFSTVGNFASDLSLCGLKNKKSGDKFIPPKALKSNLDYRKRLLAGLIDTDSYYSNGGYEYVSKSKKLIEGIKELVFSIGGRAYEIKKIKKGIKSSGFVGGYYKINFYLGDIEMPIITSRRKRKNKCFYKEPNRIAIYAEKSTEKRVYGFTLDSTSNWYITDNWMVTHNTGKSNMVGNFCFKHAEKTNNFVMNDGSKMFIAEEDFIIDPDEFAVKMITKAGNVLWIDEARDGVSRRNWASNINKTIISRKNKNRKLRKIVFLLLPFEAEVDPQMAKHVTVWIWVKTRGVCEVYCKRSGVKGGSGLNIQAILDRETKYFKENPKATMAFPTIHPEFIGRMKFGPLTAKLDKRYRDLVEKKKATGELSDEEKIKYGIEIVKDPKEIVLESIQKIKDGEIKDKKTLWEELDKSDIDDKEKLRLLNFYLKLEGWDGFNKLFDVKGSSGRSKKVW